MSELPILSPSNVAINYKLAGLFPRSAAFVLDMILAVLIGQLFVSTLGSLLINIIGADDFLFLFVQGFSRLIIFFTYFALSEYFFNGRTPGKKLLNLRTIRVDGSAATFETYAMRSVMLFLDFLLGAGAVGLLAAGSNNLRQRIGDRIAQTVVIQTNRHALYSISDLLNIKTVDTHQVLYPAAQQLTLEQALLLKQIIVRWEQRPGKHLRSIIIDAATKLSQQLKLEVVPARNLEFLRQVLRDYIVLTR